MSYWIYFNILISDGTSSPISIMAFLTSFLANSNKSALINSLIKEYKFEFSKIPLVSKI